MSRTQLNSQLAIVIIEKTMSVSVTGSVFPRSLRVRGKSAMQNFSHVASRQEISTKDNRPGLLRVVSAGVTLRSGAAEKWETAGDQRWFLPVRQATANRAKSLRQIGDDARQRPGDPACLGLLDLAMNLLLEKCGKMHQQQCGLGMLTPDNVALVPVGDGSANDQWELLLLDHGFVFSSEKSPFKPPWVSNPPQAGLPLWEFDDVLEQQWRAGSRFDAVGDVRLLVRLFQGLLTDRWQKTVLSPAEVTALKSQSSKLWKILDTALKKPDATLSDLQELANTPLSSHFRRPLKPVHTQPKSQAPLLFAALVALVACGGGAGYYFWKTSQAEVAASNSNGNGTEAPGERTVGPPEPIDGSVKDGKSGDPSRSSGAIDYSVAIRQITDDWKPNLPDNDLLSRNASLSTMLVQWRSEFAVAQEQFRSKQTPELWRNSWKELQRLTQQILESDHVPQLPGLSDDNRRDYGHCMKFIIDLGASVDVPDSYSESVSKAKSLAAAGTADSDAAAP